MPTPIDEVKAAVTAEAAKVEASLAAKALAFVSKYKAVLIAFVVGFIAGKLI